MAADITAFVGHTWDRQMGEADWRGCWPIIRESDMVVLGVADGNTDTESLRFADIAADGTGYHLVNVGMPDANDCVVVSE